MLNLQKAHSGMLSDLDRRKAVLPVYKLLFQEQKDIR
jgi:hypothetical protein